MHESKHGHTLHAFLLGAALVCASCTGGHVSKNGVPVADADLEIWTCESVGAFETQTDADGIYKFNPFLPGSPVLDLSSYVPPGPIAILISSSAGDWVGRREHKYDDTCTLPYAASTHDLPCKLQNVNLVPMTLPEVLSEAADFLETDCGLASREAELSAAAAIGRRPGHPGQLADKVTASSCLSRCAQSCIQPDVPIAEYAPCMCICVEGNCGASFGPFCTESG